MKKFINFCNALERLKIVDNYNEPYDDLQINGLVHLYEVCFEQGWKAMKEVMEDAGMLTASIGSPKQIIKQAYQAGMIGKEELWLEALKSRNDVTHSYNEEIALDIVRKVKDRYVGLFEELKASIESDWL